MKIDYLKEYIDLAETLNFTKTANDFFITQPALSKHLAYIEETLGVKLLVRSTHDVELTPQGKIVYDDFKNIVTNYENIVKKMQLVASGIIGKLTIGMLYYAVSEYIQPLVIKLQQNYPNIYLSIKSCQPYQVVQYLLEDVIDIGLVMNNNFLRPGEYNIYPLKKEKLMVICLPDHILVKKGIVSLEDISQESLVLLSLDREYSQNITELLIKHNSLPSEIIYAEQIDIVPIVLEKTNGVFIGPESLQNMPHKDLVFTEIDCNDFYFEMCFAYRKSNTNPAIQLFLKAWEGLD